MLCGLDGYKNWVKSLSVLHTAFFLYKNSHYQLGLIFITEKSLVEWFSLVKKRKVSVHNLTKKETVEARSYNNQTDTEPGTLRPMKIMIIIMGKKRK